MNQIEKIESSSLPEKTLIDINRIRLNDSWAKPQTKPNAINSPAISELNKILGVEIESNSC